MSGCGGIDGGRQGPVPPGVVCREDVGLACEFQLGFLGTPGICPCFFGWFWIGDCGKLAEGQLQNPQGLGGRKGELISDTFLRQ